jgi:hypothetical protein
MAITTMAQSSGAGDGSRISLKAHKVVWTGDAAYPYGGSAIEDVLRVACADYSLTPVALIAEDCGATNVPMLAETPARLLTAAAAWPTADQNGNTLFYKLNGAAAVTLTLAGAHTSRAHLAASLNAIGGIFAYDDGAQVVVLTDRTGPDSSFQITGGTANAVYLFSTTAAVGSTTKLLKVLTFATQLDAGAATPVSTDLSTTEFMATFLCE